MTTNADWRDVAVEALMQGERVQIRPRGSSMTGLINDGDLVALEPRSFCELVIGDAVLVRVKGKRFDHIVLHMIVACEQNKFLIGSKNGRLDGWVEADDIFGKVVQIVHVT